MIHAACQWRSKHTKLIVFKKEVEPERESVQREMEIQLDANEAQGTMIEIRVENPMKWASLPGQMGLPL